MINRCSLSPLRPLGRSLCLLALALVLALTHTAAAQESDLIVRAGEGTSKFVIAVPAFASTAPGGLTETALGDIIANDLRLSGHFAEPRNKMFVNETEQQDRAAGQIQFEKWRSLDVSYLVKGTFTVSGDEIKAEVRTYDTISRDYVFGRSYEGFKTNEVRQMAHRISNELIERLTGFPGVANTEILYVLQNDRYGKSKQVMRVDADGFNPRAITPQGELTATPAWGSNGTEVYYTTYRDYNPDLAGYMLQRKHSWWVSRKTGLNISPDWNEKVQRIALTLTKDGNSEIYTITREGKEATRLTVNPAIDSSPSWSPDGSQIAFTSDRTGAPQIYVMDVKSKGARRLTYEGNYADGAAWSPAGADRIAYAARVGGKFQIFVINADGTGARQLTSGSHDNEDPTWAPNGRVLAFTSTRTGKKQIHLLHADSGEVWPLTTGEAAHSPSWSPAYP